MPHRQFMDRPRFHRLLFNAVVVPTSLMLVIAAILVWQIDRLIKESADVRRSETIIADLNQLQALTVDMETGVRGFLVTGADEFLQPFDVTVGPVSPGVPSLIDQQSDAALRLFRPDSPQARDLQDLRARRDHWIQYARRMIDLRRSGGSFADVAANRQGKQQMDEMRAIFRRMISTETTDHMKQTDEANRAASTTIATVVSVALGAAAILGFLARRQFKHITTTYDRALDTVQALAQSLEQKVAERTEQLNARSTQLADANKELEAFGYSISHDLRAPMRHISGFADLIRRSAGPTMSADDRENLETILSTAKLAGRMVDDLLAFSRVGRTALREEPVDLSRVVAEVRQSLEPDLKDRPVEWTVGDLPTIRGDLTLLRMVFQNLLSNAVKYTAGKRPATITVDVVNDRPPGDSATDSMVTIAVADNGVGFDMAYAGKLFGVFQRLHRAEDFEGTGIGLANVRRIIQRLGGSVWAVGKLDQGATFYIRLPADTHSVTEPRST